MRICDRCNAVDAKSSVEFIIQNVNSGIGILNAIGPLDLCPSCAKIVIHRVNVLFNEKGKPEEVDDE